MQRARATGLAWPTLVVDTAEGGKAPVGPDHAARGEDGGWTVDGPLRVA